MEKLYPLERGFAGNRIEGQKLGSPPPVGDANFDDFQTYCLQVCFLRNTQTKMWIFSNKLSCAF